MLLRIRKLACKVVVASTSSCAAARPTKSFIISKPVATNDHLNLPSSGGLGFFAKSCVLLVALTDESSAADCKDNKRCHDRNDLLPSHIHKHDETVSFIYATLPWTFIMENYIPPSRRKRSCWQFQSRSFFPCPCCTGCCHTMAYVCPLIASPH